MSYNQPPPPPPPPPPGQPYGGQPYGAVPPQAPPPGAPWTPGAPPPSGGSGKKGLWIALAVIGVLVLIGAALVLGIVVFGGGDDGSSDSTSDASTSGSSAGSSDQAVDAVVTQFLDAAKTNDCDAIKDIITDHFQKVIGECDTSGDTVDSYTIDDTRVDDSAGTAEVDATATEGGTDLPLTLKLVKDGNDWKIDDFDVSDIPDVPSASVPSGIPTDFLSDFPTDLPSGFPTDFPTDPSEIESYINSYLGSLTASP
jgi:hypothetical protein